MLELMATLNGVRCIQYVRDQLRLDITNTYLWSDSRVALSWINSDKSLPGFARNRVLEIKGHNDIVMGYVITKENRAYAAAKGTTAKALFTHDLWWYGPDWLSKPSNDWKTNDIVIEIDRDIGDISPSISTSRRKSKEKHFNNSPLGIDCERFSSITNYFLSLCQS